MKIQYAEKCAWRAFYCITNKGYQFAHLGIDPTASKPNIFGSLLSMQFRIYLPFMYWEANESRLKRKWRNWITSLDGRF